MQQDLINRLNKITEQLSVPAQERPPQLLAVSKKHPPDAIATLYRAGLKRFGESYLQEALRKIQALSELDIEWHFIGPIQSNKTKPIAENFAWVDSVDRIKILQRLSHQRPQNLPPLQVLLQLKIGNEAGKSGTDKTTIEQMLNMAKTMKQINIRGLMCIPPPSDKFEQQQSHFMQAKQLFDQLQAQHPRLDTLSMGMSNDLQAAIACGSTQVRVGTALFGHRR